MPLERLQKILSERGVASRRGAEELIAAGKVKVNGHPAKVGDKADARRDVILVAGKRLAPPEEPLYIMLHKPRGFITTLKDEQGRRCVADLLGGVPGRVYPVGRLDRESEGLLLLTGDGDFANAVMHPRGHVPKRYRVTLRGAVPDAAVLAFREGMLLEGSKTAPAELEIVTVETAPKDEQGRARTLRSVADITLYEGRNRQIRRMCEALGLEVMRLKRVAVGPVKLGMLKPGDWRYLEPKEVKALVLATQVEQKIAAAYIKRTSPPGDVRHERKGGAARDTHRGRGRR